jgi:hypothetical protein
MQNVVVAQETATRPIPPASTAVGADHDEPAYCTALPAESVARQNSTVTQETDEKLQTLGSITTGAVHPVPSKDVMVPA